MKYVKESFNADGAMDGYTFDCPGCENMHFIPIASDEDKPLWKFNGDFESPTFEPSVNIKWTDAEGNTHLCNFSIQDADIKYQADCTHRFAGQEMRLPVASGGWD